MINSCLIPTNLLMSENNNVSLSDADSKLWADIIQQKLESGFPDL